MPERGNDFAGRLLSQQGMDPELQEKYRKELKEMLEVKIEGGRKAFSIFIITVRYMIGFISLFLFFYFPTFLPGMLRFVCGLVGVSLLALAVLGSMTVIKGIYKHRTHGNIAAAIVFYGIVGAWVVLIYTGLDEPLVAVCGTIMLALAVIKMAANLILQSKLDARERLLEQEYRMAEMRPGQ